MQAGTSTGLGLFRQSLRIGVLLGCLALFHQVATADELTDALIRYALQDYAHAIALLVPLADRGNVVAQMQLGLIYGRDKAFCDVQATARQGNDCTFARNGGCRAVLANEDRLHRRLHVVVDAAPPGGESPVMRVKPIS